MISSEPISKNELIAHKNVIACLDRENLKSHNLLTVLVGILTAEILGTAFVWEKLLEIKILPLSYGLYSLIFFTFIAIIIASINLFDELFHPNASHSTIVRYLVKIVYSILLYQKKEYIDCVKKSKDGISKHIFYNKGEYGKRYISIKNNNKRIRELLQSDIIYSDYLINIRWKIREKSIIVLLYSFVSTVVTLILMSVLYNNLYVNDLIWRIYPDNILYQFTLFLGTNTIKIQYFIISVFLQFFILWYLSLHEKKSKEKISFFNKIKLSLKNKMHQDKN